MKISIDVPTTPLGKAMREKRGNRSLRDITAESGISAPTFNRIERGGKPNLDVFYLAMKWLRIPVNEFSKYHDWDVR